MPHNFFEVILDDKTPHHQSLHLIEQFLIFASSIATTYPNFHVWFHSKVIPGIYRGERAIILIYGHGSLCAAAVIKNTPDERKICSLKVCETKRSLGLGRLLFERCFEILGTAKPHLSVNSSRQHLFERSFRRYGFIAVDKRYDDMRNTTSEIFYNEER